MIESHQDAFLGKRRNGSEWVSLCVLLCRVGWAITNMGDKEKNEDGWW